MWRLFVPTLVAAWVVAWEYSTIWLAFHYMPFGFGPHWP
jgi:hypothetical protein